MEELYKDELRKLLVKHNYILAEYGTTIAARPQEPQKYATLILTKNGAKVATNSSLWTTDEVILVAQELQETMALAAQINVLARELGI